MIVDFLLITFVLLSICLGIIFADDLDEDFTDFTITKILIFILICPGFYLVNLTRKLEPFLSQKPFKKARFTVGESVLYNGKAATILKNEKMCTGDRVVVTFMSGSYMMRLEVFASEVRKASKLEQAL